MMAGGTLRHAQVQGNVFAWLRSQLRGSGCRTFSSDVATQTHDLSIRYPDISVFCRAFEMADDKRKALDDSRVIVEILSAGTARTDLKTKLYEYQALPSVDTIVFVDTATGRLRVVQRTGPHSWHDTDNDQRTDVALPSLSLTIPHEEIFARD